MHRRSLTTLIGFTLALVVLMSTVALGSVLRNFVSPMDSDQEVAEEPVVSDATGVATYHLSKDGTELSYRLNVANIENVTMAHIHLGPRGVNGPIVVWLFPEEGQAPTLIEGRSQGTLATGTITEEDLVGPLEGGSLEDLLEAIRAGNTYTNVHTQQFPAGEIRGQIDRPRGHIH